MRAIAYNQVLQPALELYGHSYNDSEPGAELKRRFQNFISRRLRSAWENANWPDLMGVERWRFAPTYHEAASYLGGDFVYYPPTGKYYQALGTVAFSEETPETAGVVNTAYWQLAGVSWAKNEWASGTSYAVGDVVWYPVDNQFYACIQATDTIVPGQGASYTYWSPLVFFAGNRLDWSQEEPAIDLATASYANSRANVTLADHPSLAGYSLTSEVRPGDLIEVVDVDDSGVDAYNGRWEVLARPSSSVIQFQSPTIGYAGTGGTVRWVHTSPGRVRSVYDRDPRYAVNWREHDFEVDGDGILVAGAGSQVWVEYQRECPLLTGGNYDETATYAVGDQVLFNSSGETLNFYDCRVATSAGESPTTAPAKWDLVEIPYIFHTYLVHGALSDALKMDGNHAAAGAQAKIADAALAEEEVKQWNLQPQRNRIAVNPAY